MVINSNVGARTLLEYLSSGDDYEIPEVYSSNKLSDPMPENESFRLRFKQTFTTNREYEIMVQYAHLMNHIIDFYSIEKDGKLNNLGNGSMTFYVPSGLITVVTTPFDNEVLISSRYLSAGN